MITTSNVSSSSAPRTLSHDDYAPMLSAVREHFAGMVAGFGPQLFTTDIEGRDLWAAYLNSLPANERQQHNCHACRRFIENFGGLVTIDEEGNTRSAMMGPGPGIYAESFRAVRKAVERARVTGVFLASETTWGTPSTRDGKRNTTWHHMHVVPPVLLRFKHAIMTADQRAAELGEDYGTLCRALADFKFTTITQALAIAQAESLYRGEKIEGRLKWLAELHAKRAQYRASSKSAGDFKRDNVTWRAVATAPAGFCHVRSSVVGSLLEDIEAGKSFEAVKRAFDEKMNPLKYQRPTAPPSAGNLKQAEAIVEKLGSANALLRRFAKLDEIKTIWTPAPAKPYQVAGVFGHLNPKNAVTAPMVTSAPFMTWEKFARTILPNAEKIEAHAPPHGHYTAFVTAVDIDAPPIVQWDSAGPGGARNPVTWYTYSSGSIARQWNITAGLVEVTAISPMPNMWQEGFKHHGEGVMVVLKDCRDTRAANLCLFPEFLKSEYHSIRSSIEAYSRSKEIEGAEQASACGLTVRAGSPVFMKLRVHSKGTVTDYKIDRWD